MVNRFSFENRTAGSLQILVEPEAINIDIPTGESIDIELTLKSAEFEDKFAVLVEKGRLIIYESRQYEMKIFINNLLEYCTPPGRYW
jgi:hypothetical protein